MLHTQRARLKMKCENCNGVMEEVYDIEGVGFVCYSCMQSFEEEQEQEQEQEQEEE